MTTRTPFLRPAYTGYVKRGVFMRLGRKRYIRNQTKMGTLMGCFLAVLCATGFLYYMLCVFRPAFAALAENRVKELAVVTINRAVSESLAAEQASYSDVVELEQNDEHSVTALKSNLTGISKLKSDLNLAVIEKISAMDTTLMHVPLGSVLGSDFFAGLGPMIPFRVAPFGTAETDIITDFMDAGINQTRLDVSVKVKADMSLLFPTIRKKSTVETTVPILQTVIVGTVPDSYTHVDRDGYEYEDDVLELAD